MRSWTTVLTAVCAALLWAGAPQQATAQTVVVEGIHHGVSIGDASLRQVVVPIGLTWRVAGVRIDANTAYASATYKQEQMRSELSGLTDLNLRLLVPVYRDRARVILGVSVPTGTEKLTDAQLPVAGIITTDLLALPVRNFGTGRGLTGGLAMAQPLGSWVGGAVVLYRVGSTYEPFAPTTGVPPTEFRPGSEFRMRLGLERPQVGGVSWRFAGSWSRFTPDAVAEADIFARGDRVLGEATAEFPVRRGSGVVYGWSLYRSGSELLTGAGPEPTPSNTLVGVGTRLVQPVNPRLSIRPRAELMLQRGTLGFGSGTGWVARAGSGASYRMGRVRVDPAVLVQGGELDGESLLGLVLRAGVLWRR